MPKMKQVIIKVDTQEQKENLKNTRKSLKVIQHTAGSQNKENLAGRPLQDSKSTTSAIIEKVTTFEDKAVQTGECVITAQDLTSEEPSSDYWKKLAEKRGDLLNESLDECEKLRNAMEALRDENKVCKEMLEESKCLVEVLKEMLGESAEEE